MDKSELPSRKNIRLKDFDYSQPNYYYVTICVDDKRCLLWNHSLAGNYCRGDYQSPEVLTAHGIRGRNDCKNAILLPDRESEQCQCRGDYQSPESNKKYELSNIGKVTETAIGNIEKIYKSVRVDKYTIMPNHIHMIIAIETDDCGRVILAPTISRIVQQMKSYVVKQIGKSIWQKGFYDEIIRNQIAYEKIWLYIDSNPLKWEKDEYFNI